MSVGVCFCTLTLDKARCRSQDAISIVFTVAFSQAVALGVIRSDPDSSNPETLMVRPNRRGVALQKMPTPA